MGAVACGKRPSIHHLDLPHATSAVSPGAIPALPRALQAGRRHAIAPWPPREASCWTLTTLTPQNCTGPRVFSPFLSQFRLRSTQRLLHFVSHLLAGGLVAFGTGPRPRGEGILQGGLPGTRGPGARQLGSDRPLLSAGSRHLLPGTPQAFPCARLCSQLLIKQ